MTNRDRLTLIDHIPNYDSLVGAPLEVCNGDLSNFIAKFEETKAAAARRAKP